MHRMILSDRQCNARVSCTLHGPRKCIVWSFLHRMFANIATRSLEHALGFLRSRKLNIRVVVIRHLDGDLDTSGPDLMNAFDDLLYRRAMRVLQRFIALGPVFNMMCDDPHDFFAWATKEDQDSRWCDGLGPALFDRGVRQVQRFEKRNHVRPSVWIFLRGCKLLAPDF